MPGISTRFFDELLKRGELAPKGIIDELARVPENLPAKLGAAANERHGKLVQSLIDSSNPELINPKTVSSTASNLSKIPGDLLDSAGIQTKFYSSPNSSDPLARGVFTRQERTAKINQFNETHPATVAHETLGHPFSMFPEDFKSYLDPHIDNLKRIDSINLGLSFHADKNPDYLKALLGLPRNATTEDVSKELYKSRPTEHLANAVGGFHAGAMSSPNFTPELFKSVLRPYLDKKIPEILDTATARFKPMKSTSDSIYKNLGVALPIAAGAGITTYATPSNAANEVSQVPNANGTQVSKSNNPQPRKQNQEKSNIDNSEEEAKKFFLPANVMLGDPSEGIISPFVKKVGEAATLPVRVGADIVKAGWNSLKSLSSAMDPSGKGAQEYMQTHSTNDVLGDLLNVGIGSGVAGEVVGGGVKGGLGAIGLPGFKSSLTEAIQKGVVGKSVLSPKMTGEQLLKTLQSAGIKEDELVFSGVGDALASIGKDRVGSTKMAEIAKIAEEGALGFTKMESPGTHSWYSLFNEGDPSFKNVVYSYPGVKFEEGHFGEGVVAHRRVGDKEILPFGSKLTLSQPEKEALTVYRKYNGDAEPAWLKDKINEFNAQKPINSLLLDEVQSQFYEKGSKFGHGGMKGLPEGVVPTDPSGNYKRFGDAYKGATGKPGYTVPENMKDDMTRYVELGDVAENVDRSSPQGFAKGLSVDDEAAKIYSRHVPETDLSVENAPLRGEKYVELLAKDHLRDALMAGKDAISWTPSEVQHERYYGKGGLGRMRWEFSPGKTDSNNSTILLFQGSDPYVGISDMANLKSHVGASAAEDILSKMSSGEVNGSVEGNAKEVYQKLYDRAIPKVFEKLTGEKPREGFVKGRNGNDVKIQWVPLDKAKGKMMLPASDTEFYLGERQGLEEIIRRKQKDIKDNLSDASAVGNRHYFSHAVLPNDSMTKVSSVINSFVTPENRDWRSLQNFIIADETLNSAEKQAIRYKIRELQHLENAAQLKTDIDKYAPRLEELTPKVKDLPIANAEQVAKDFFNV